MMNNTILKHPSILHGNKVNEICHPLKALYDIDYFAHVNVDTSGNFTALGKNPKFVEHYLKQQYYDCDVHLANNPCQEEYVLQDSVDHYGITNQLFQDCTDFKLFHIFTLIYRNEHSVDAYHFATSKKNNRINEVYLTHLPLLKNFIAYFKESVNNNKALKKAYDFKFNISKQTAFYDSDLSHLPSQAHVNQFIDQLKVKQFHFPGYKNSYLTQREMECLLWMHYGKSAPEIQKVMNITERTVRAHINNIKKKLNCRSLFQLGEKVNNFDLIRLIEHHIKSTD